MLYATRDESRARELRCNHPVCGSRNHRGGILAASDCVEDRPHRGAEGDKVLVATEQRQQRATLYLKDVAYIVDAHFEMTKKAGETDTPEKHYNIALRRLRKGQCFNQPVLGCREFPAKVTLADESVELRDGFYSDVPEKDLGFMLYDLDFSDAESPVPHFYRAVMRNGVIDVAGAAGEMVA